MSTPQEWTFGMHRVRFEPPDFQHVRLVGHVRYEDARALVGLARELGTRRPFYMVVDMSASPSVDVEASAYAAVNLRARWFLGVAYVGASRTMRAAARTLAMLLTVTVKRDFDIDFVSSEEEAYRSIARQRGQGTGPTT